MNSELASYGQHEYRLTDDFAVSLRSFLHPPKETEKSPSQLQVAAGTVFQRRVMGPIERFRAPLIDGTAIPVSEIIQDIAKVG